MIADMRSGCFDMLWARGFLRLIIAAACLALTGCNAGRVSEENSRLRRENMALSGQVEASKSQVERLRGQIQALQAKVDTPGPALPDVQASDLPVVTKITFGKYSGVMDTDGDGADDVVRVYVHTLDQHGRFLPAVGRAIVQVVTIEPDAAPRQLARAVFEPKQFTAAYRSGFTGTHYTLEAKLDPPLAKDAGDVTIKVTFTDAATGAAFMAQLLDGRKAKPPGE